MVCIVFNDTVLSNDLRISSIVYSVYLDQEIDIKQASQIFEKSKVYDSIRLNFKMIDPRATICMSKSGYIRSMGTDSFNNAKNTIDITLEKLLDNKILREINVTKERIENIVASGTISNRLDLEELSLNLNNSIYEPEQFPAIIYRPLGKIVMLLFANGKIVIVGAKTIDEINTAYDNLNEKLKDV